LDAQRIAVYGRQWLWWNLLPKDAKTSAGGACCDPASSGADSGHAGYGQHCPLSLASELLCQRWTVLVMRRIIAGCTGFNEIHRGLPKMSASLLTRRLHELERAGIVETRPIEGGKWREYVPTPRLRSGRERLWSRSAGRAAGEVV
jgi:DNA-binding HxlR family transcriptional regulator